MQLHHSLCLLLLLGCASGSKDLRKLKPFSDQSAREESFRPEFRSILRSEGYGDSGGSGGFGGYGGFGDSGGFGGFGGFGDFGGGFGNERESGNREKECPFPYQQVGNNCYYASCPGDFSNRMNWTTATQYCQSTIRGGGNLAIFETANEFADVLRYISTLTPNCSYWIGGFNNAPTTAPNPVVWTWYNNQRMPLGIPFWAVRSGALLPGSTTTPLFAFLDYTLSYFINYDAIAGPYYPLCQVRLQDEEGYSNSGENQNQFTPYFRSSLNDDNFFQQRLLNPLRNLPSPYQTSQGSARSQLPFGNRRPEGLLRRNQNQNIFSSKQPTGRTPVTAPQYRNDPVLFNLGAGSEVPIINPPLKEQLADPDNTTEVDGPSSDLQSSVPKEEATSQKEEDLEEEISMSENNSLLNEYLTELEKNQTAFLPKEEQGVNEKHETNSSIPATPNVEPKVHNETPVDETLSQESTDQSEVEEEDKQAIHEALPPMNEGKDSPNYESSSDGHSKDASETDLQSDHASIKQVELQTSETETESLPQQVDPSTKEKVSIEKLDHELTSEIKEPLVTNEKELDKIEETNSAQEEPQAVERDDYQSSVGQVPYFLNRVTYNEAPKFERRRNPLRDPFAEYLPGMISDIATILKNIDQTYKPRQESV